MGEGLGDRMEVGRSSRDPGSRLGPLGGRGAMSWQKGCRGKAARPAKCMRVAPG